VTHDPTSRVLELLSLLQTHKRWQGGELAARLDVSARTLRRDIDRLRRLGYPVEATTGSDGGYQLAAGAHLPPLLLDDDEAVAIAVGLRAAAGAAIDGIDETAVRALVKLEQLLPDRLRRRVSAIHGNVAILRWATDRGPTVDPDDLALLAQACRDHEEARFDYRSRDDTASQRLVEPHQLVSAGRRWYLAAYDLRRADWRTFRLDRLTRARLAGARFTPRPIPGGDAATYVAGSIGSMPRAVEAIVRVDRPAEELADTLHRIDHELVETGPASCTIRLRADAEDWIVWTIASLAAIAEVTVEEPDHIARAVEDVGRRLLASTGRGGSSGGG
jgi:predicted DNA-binding transcriptional regulator YafY